MAYSAQAPRVRSPSLAPVGLALVFVTLAVSALLVVLVPLSASAAQTGLAGAPVQLRGRLLEDPRSHTGPGASADSSGAPVSCRVLLEAATARHELVFPSCPELRQGWRIAVSGTVLPLRPAPHPLLSGPAERLARQGVSQRLRVERLEVLARSPAPIADLRRRIASRFMEAAGADRGGLLAALVLGSAVVPLPPELREAFRAAGLSHALAASGFHLSVLLGAVLAIGRGLGRAPRLLLAGGAISLFLLLAGPQPSVVRAVLMGASALLLLECGRRGRPLAMLLLTVVVMLLLRPLWLADVGFQLSVTATAALVVSAGPIEAALQTRLPPWLRPGWSAPALAVPLAAMLWTLPLQLLHFGVLPLYAIPANVAATPLLTPLTLGAMAMALPAALLPALPGVLLWPLDQLAGLLLRIARGFAALPMAQAQIGRPQPFLVALLAAALLGLALPGLARRWRGLAAALLALVVLLQGLALHADRLLLVHQGFGGRGRDLLIARHGGRAALIATRADPFSCRQSRQLATGLGITRFDWALLLDPVAPADPACWSQQAGSVLAYGEAAAPLAANQTLSSDGLAVTALSMDSHALRLRYGSRHWLLLPDRQALWAVRQQAGPELPLPGADGLWLGFQPHPGERASLQRGPASALVWLSGAPPPSSPMPAGWRSSGASGFLVEG
jgi:competence protein ComEC